MKAVRRPSAVPVHVGARPAQAAAAPPGRWAPRSARLVVVGRAVERTLLCDGSARPGGAPWWWAMSRALSGWRLWLCGLGVARAGSCDCGTVCQICWRSWAPWRGGRRRRCGRAVCDGCDFCWRSGARRLPPAAALVLLTESARRASARLPGGGAGCPDALEFIARAGRFDLGHPVVVSQRARKLRVVIVASHR